MWATPSGDAALDPQVLARFETSGADAIGPVARMLVGKAPRAVQGWGELIALLASSVPTQAEQAAFRRSPCHSHRVAPWR